tara:strand:+ start:354 stop:527 length:174 start_codon:yes stop_codon:yes gene_type:complete
VNFSTSIYILKWGIGKKAKINSAPHHLNQNIELVLGFGWLSFLLLLRTALFLFWDSL